MLVNDDDHLIIFSTFWSIRRNNVNGMVTHGSRFDCSAGVFVRLVVDFISFVPPCDSDTAMIIYMVNNISDTIK